MKIIKVSTELEMTIHEFPTGTLEEQTRALCELIGNDCDTIEHVMPMRLYSSLHMSNRLSENPGECVSMLIDENGRLKPNKVNVLGSYLYEMDKHGCPIVGNVLFVGEYYESYGISFCGISDAKFDVLEKGLRNMILAMEAFIYVNNNGGN